MHRAPPCSLLSSTKWRKGHASTLATRSVSMSASAEGAQRRRRGAARQGTVNVRSWCISLVVPARSGRTPARSGRTPTRRTARRETTHVPHSSAAQHPDRWPSRSTFTSREASARRIKRSGLAPESTGGPRPALGRSDLMHACCAAPSSRLHLVCSPCQQGRSPTRAEVRGFKYVQM